MQATELPLKDIHLPEAISWFPPAIGWWLLAIVIPLFIAFLYWLYRRLTRKTAVKAAKKLLIAIRNDHETDNHKKLRDLSTLLRRVAISLSPRADVASLTGQAWLLFLDGSLKDAPFSNGIGRCLADAPYRPTAMNEAELNQLMQLCENWLNAQATLKLR